MASHKLGHFEPSSLLSAIRICIILLSVVLPSVVQSFYYVSSS
jgi:hypothetical protein